MSLGRGHRELGGDIAGQLTPKDTPNQSTFPSLLVAKIVFNTLHPSISELYEVLRTSTVPAVLWTEFLFMFMDNLLLGY